MKDQDIKKIEVTFEFVDVGDLVCHIDHLVGTCQTALLYHQDNRSSHLNDRELDEIHGSTFLGIASTLRMAKRLIEPLFDEDNYPSPH